MYALTPVKLSVKSNPVIVFMRLVIKLVLYYQSVCFHQSIYSRGDNRCLLLLFSFPKTVDASAIFVNSFGLSIIVQKSSGRHSRAMRNGPCVCSSSALPPVTNLSPSVA